MKYITALVALAAAATAAPNYPGDQCKPVAYRCSKDPKTGAPGWDVCDTSGHFVYGGNCPPKTVCKFLDKNGSPYCVPPDFNIPA